MWDDKINRRIKEAADQYHPAYDEKAWSRMEQMLNEHLPQKKDRRRIIYLLLFTVIVCAGLFFIFYQNGKNTSSKISQEIISAKNARSGEHEKIKPQNELQQKKTGQANAAGNYKHNETAFVIKKDFTGNKRQHYALLVTTSNIQAESAVSKNDEKDSDITRDEQNNERIKNQVVKTTFLDNENNSNYKVESVALRNDDITTISKSTSDSTAAKMIAKEEIPKKSNSSKNINKSNQKFKQNFGITLSVGPDVSGVNLRRIGEVTLAYGAGLSYNLSDRFTLRTGFYISKKIYSVGKDEYKIQPVNGNYNYLQSVDGDCNVYEIPLTINYNFSRVRNHSWFAGAGLSSYLMKKESYDYYYKYPSGNVYDKSWTISNKNKHYFAVLDISGGYEYAISKKIKLSAEPYLKLPLSGIGAGKIKLNSGGVLFTATLNLFKK